MFKINKKKKAQVSVEMIMMIAVVIIIVIGVASLFINNLNKNTESTAKSNEKVSDTVSNFVNDMNSINSSNQVVNPNPPINLVVNITSPTNNQEFDISDLITFNVIVSNSTGAVDYVWTENTTILNNSVNFIKSANYFGVGPHTVNVTVTDDSGSLTKSVSFSVSDSTPNLSVNITAPTNNAEYYADQTINFSSTISNPTGGVSYVWKKGATIFNTIGSFTKSAGDFDIGSNTVTLDVTDSLPSTASDSVSFTVYPPISVSILSPINGSNYNTCESINFNSSIDNNFSPVACSWLSNSKILSSDCNFSSSLSDLMLTSEGEIPISFKVSGDFPIKSDSININVVETPEFIINIKQPPVGNKYFLNSCSTSVIVDLDAISDTNIGSMSCNWYIDNGINKPVEISDNCTDNVDICKIDGFIPAPGDYNLVVSAMDDCSTASDDVIVHILN